MFVMRTVLTENKYAILFLHILVILKKYVLNSININVFKMGNSYDFDFKLKKSELN